MVETWGERVVAATSAALDALQPLTDCRWDVPAGDLEWSCHRTAIHVASDLTKYAAQLAGGVDGSYPKFMVTASEDEPPDELLRIIDACGRLLGFVVDSAPAEAVAWHWGPTDRSGFAAMGIGELLVHAYDITRGLGRDWRPPEELAASVVTRLQQGTETGDPSIALLWSTGRIDVEGLDPVSQWGWRPANP